jgi:CDP-diacylglycerol--serine O-phosphatidyltransferase
MLLARDIWLLSFPVIFGGVTHMLVVRRDWFRAIKCPIHERTFGASKTWRGFVFVPIATAIGTGLASAQQCVLVVNGAQGPFESVNWLLLGILLGLAYMLAELPNSWIKRRMGVPPGLRPSHYSKLFLIVDHSDSVLGCVLVYALLTPVDLASILAACLCGPLLHLAVNAALVRAGLRERY